MALIFQYGSNMSTARLNGEDQLVGDAKLIGVARTVAPFEFGFTVWSGGNGCAAADLVPSEQGRSIYGILYEVPDFLLSRDTAEPRGRKSFDEIEGEYVRTPVELIAGDGSKVQANTYLVRERVPDLKTSLAYVSHILLGLKEHGIPAEYCEYVRSRIVENNRELEGQLQSLAPHQ